MLEEGQLACPAGAHITLALSRAGQEFASCPITAWPESQTCTRTAAAAAALPPQPASTGQQLHCTAASGAQPKLLQLQARATPS